MNNYCHSCGPIDGFVYPDLKKLKDTAAKSHLNQSPLSCSICVCDLLIECQIEREGSVSLPNLTRTQQVEPARAAVIPTLVYI